MGGACYRCRKKRRLLHTSGIEVPTPHSGQQGLPSLPTRLKRENSTKWSDFDVSMLDFEWLPKNSFLRQFSVKETPTLPLSRRHYGVSIQLEPRKEEAFKLPTEAMWRC